MYKLSNYLKEVEVPYVDGKELRKKLINNNLLKKAREDERIKYLNKSPREKRNEMILNALEKKKVLEKTKRFKKDLENKIRSE